jgi:hypothetical protein
LPRPAPVNALSATETAELLAVLRSARFFDLAPAQVWAILRVWFDLYVAIDIFSR